MRRKSPITGRVLAALVVVGAIFWLLTKAELLAVAVAVLAFFIILKVGYGVVGGLATPLPPPPPPGELRKVRLIYRCSICGTEVRMTAANDEVPDPPRHCQDEMDLVAPVD